MQGLPLTRFLPLDASAFQRRPSLRTWISDVCGDIGELAWLEPEHWYTRGHTSDACIWAPPPAAADAALEQLCISRHKRPFNFHLIVVPRLFTGRWRKHLARATDFNITFDNDTIWPLSSQFEPLLIFLCLPFHSHRPNFGARKKLLGELDSLLQARRLQQAHQEWFRHRLRQLLGRAWELREM